jgi:hypothetical protein
MGPRFNDRGIAYLVREVEQLAARSPALQRAGIPLDRVKVRQ